MANLLTMKVDFLKKCKNVRYLDQQEALREGRVGPQQPATEVKESNTKWLGKFH